ncbi:MAG: hypothetical protein Q9220_004891 [cf. Caloplaca sp. 1 TL-2023]
MAFLALFVSLALFSLSLTSAHNFPVGTKVQTSSGVIIGHAARNRTRVSEYLGIPYARPPVGDLRFAAPQSFSSSSVFNASSYINDRHFSYRLNIFGFSGAPGETQNVGLLDQRKAIEWVRDNIAGFGGDPTRISIMGQSAGGATVDYYSYAYKEDPIVAGLISHSGTALSFKPNTVDFAQASFLSAAAMLGCSGSDLVACMRNQNLSAVLNASAKVKPLPSSALAQPVFHPTVDNVTVFGNYTAMSTAGAFAKIPYLAGNTDKEDGFYRISAAGQNVTLTEQQWLLFDLEGFTCPTAVEISSRAKAGVPAWRYRYFGDWPNLRLYPGSGSYHGSDLHMIFGGIEDIVGPNLPNTVPEKQTMEYMMRAWATFVNNPASGLSKKLHWPRYDASSDTLVRLGYMQNPRATFISPRVYDDACPKNGSTAEAQGAF